MTKSEPIFELFDRYCENDGQVTQLQEPTPTPDTETTTGAAAAGKGRPRMPLFTSTDLFLWMNATGYSVRHNLITHELEFKDSNGKTIRPDDFVVTVHDSLGDKFKSMSADWIRMKLAYIGAQTAYNPVIDLLNGVKWDGRDRLEQLCFIMGIEDDKLSQVYVRKWLYQTVALLFNNEEEPFGADGVLVLNGPQGVGKTSLLRHLALNSAFFLEGGIIKDSDKDYERRCLTCWICELGEVGTTLKSDVDRLKNFITAPFDKYRLPYGRTDTEVARRTSLAASCNDEQYLIDITGNRRWWTVRMTRQITRDDLEALDALQLWAQVFSDVSKMTHKQKEACFRLTDDEREALIKRNVDFEKPVKAEDEVRDILCEAQEKGYMYKVQTVSEFKTVWEILKPYSVNQIGVALKRCGYSQTRTKTQRGYNLPVRWRYEREDGGDK